MEQECRDSFNWKAKRPPNRETAQRWRKMCCIVVSGTYLLRIHCSFELRFSKIDMCQNLPGYAPHSVPIGGGGWRGVPHLVPMGVPHTDLAGVPCPIRLDGSTSPHWAGWGKPLIRLGGGTPPLGWKGVPPCRDLPPPRAWTDWKHYLSPHPSVIIAPRPRLEHIGVDNICPC